MKRPLLNFFLILAVVLVVSTFLQSRSYSADEAKFKGVIPFITPNGTLGFFNQNDGKLYIYDTALKNCIVISQLDELGRTMVPIKMR